VRRIHCLFFCGRCPSPTPLFTGFSHAKRKTGDFVPTIPMTRRLGGVEIVTLFGADHKPEKSIYFVIKLGVCWCGAMPLNVGLDHSQLAARDQALLGGDRVLAILRGGGDGPGY